MVGSAISLLDQSQYFPKIHQGTITRDDTVLGNKTLLTGTIIWGKESKCMNHRLKEGLGYTKKVSYLKIPRGTII